MQGGDRRRHVRQGMQAAGFIMIAVVASASARTPHPQPHQHHDQPRVAVGPVQSSLVIPPLLTGTTSDGVTTFSLTAQQGTRVLDGVSRRTAGFNDTYLGPTIRIAQGQRVRIRVTNRLSESTTVHWHGLHVPAEDDGGPYQAIEAGATWEPNFTVSQPATTLWYHPHLMGKTAEQVARGMVGMLQITDDSAGEQALPHNYGVNDIPLIFQPAPAPAQAASSPPGRLLVNGSARAIFNSPESRVRIRMVNASGGDVLGVRFRGARRVWQVASDGGLLAAPVSTDRVLLAPSERAQFVVDTNPSQPVTVSTARIADRGAAATREQAGFMAGTVQPQPEAPLLWITSATASRSTELPATLASIPDIDTSKAVTRNMDLGPRLEINGMQMLDMTDMSGLLQIPLNETDVWTIRNRSDVTHAFHVHDIEFRVLSRNGAPPPPSERGWKDTVRAAPGDVIRIAMTFTDFADSATPYMLHCHVLRHEDAGMMQPFVVVSPAAARAHHHMPGMDMSGMDMSHMEM